MCLVLSRRLHATYSRHKTTMADDKIDPALVRITASTLHYLEGFFQKGDPGHVVIWTSTCTDMPARVQVHTERQWKPMMYAGIAAEFYRMPRFFLGRYNIAFNSSARILTHSF